MFTEINADAAVLMQYTKVTDIQSVSYCLSYNSTQGACLLGLTTAEFIINRQLQVATVDRVILEGPLSAERRNRQQYSAAPVPSVYY